MLSNDAVSVLKDAKLEPSYVLISNGDSNIPIGEVRLFDCVAAARPFVPDTDSVLWVHVCEWGNALSSPAFFIFEVGADHDKGVAAVLHLIEGCGMSVYLSLLLPNAWIIDDADQIVMAGWAVQEKEA